MVIANHIVQSATLNFRFDEQENNFNLPGKIERWFLQKAIKQIEQSCDEVADASIYIEIDELEIDLGQISLKQFEDELHQVFKKELLSKLIEHKRTNNNKNINRKSKIAQELTLIEFLFFFLKKGHFSWSNSFSSSKELAEAIKNFYKKNRIQNIEIYISLLCQKQIQNRLIYNFPANFIVWLVNKLVVQVIEEKQLNISNPSFIENEGQKELLTKFTKWITTIERGKIKNPTIEEDNMVGLNDQTDENKQQNPSNRKDSEDMGLFVANAGVVILNPFISLLFENLNLLKENDFKTQRLREKGVWILFYMVNGHLDFDESQVVFLKLLCGIAIEEELKYKPVLSKSDKAEIEIVIEHAIKYWEVLKNTGNDSFRETFLQREGLLKIHDHYLEITVEQRGADMLIGQLPWPLSLIKLPWLDRKVHVNWA
ncbi:contractile injection system tape measure protein [Mangrovivirga sp. M17]|uniref:Contractile injection system tape measure protein n=1 Tax=Mangrovivirga halotolerans TaxID=2993936 RepID=A0ABT3RQ12_9BACT|nr:contractile injection system tape measure protein [Mangrovivirga halotolerans]MCX2743879.1 contractile injection system tape measure protein [Mangrovivirga halotolerans]